MDEVNKYRRKKLQQFIHRRDVAEMNIQNTPNSIIEAVKGLMTKKDAVPSDRYEMETKKPVKTHAAPKNMKPNEKHDVDHKPEKMKVVKPKNNTKPITEEEIITPFGRINPETHVFAKQHKDGKVETIHYEPKKAGKQMKYVGKSMKHDDVESAKKAHPSMKMKMVKEGTEPTGVHPKAVDSHNCATHVYHEQYGEGTPIHSQHAEPDENGEIAWYDVIFDHGLERKVSISEMTVLTMESHGNHKKKKK